jgi:hypothetical protein
VGFLGVGLVSAAGAFGGYATRANAAASAQVWRLDPDLDCAPAGGCSRCKACRAHGAAKLFASAAAADANRAHLYCKCRVAPYAVVDDSVYNALFVDGGNRPSVDLRRQWVQAVLAQAPALPTVSDGRAHALARHQFMRRKMNGTRWLYVDIDADEAVIATLAVMRNGATLAERTVSGGRGHKRRKLEIPRDVKAGPARLRVTLRDAGGDADTLSRVIQIPNVWPVRR